MTLPGEEKVFPGWNPWISQGCYGSVWTEYHLCSTLGYVAQFELRIKDYTITVIVTKLKRVQSKGTLKQNNPYSQLQQVISNQWVISVNWTILTLWFDQRFLMLRRKCKRTFKGCSSHTRRFVAFRGSRALWRAVIVPSRIWMLNLITNDIPQSVSEV